MNIFALRKKETKHVRQRFSRCASTRGALKIAAALAAVGIGAGAKTAQAQSIYNFSDEFNGGALDAGTWDVYDGSRSLQRTQFGKAPVFATDADGTRYARIGLDTYNSDRSQPSMLRGTEMMTKRLFSLPPTGGLQFEARVRAANLPRGLVGAFYTYGYRGVWPDTYYSDEIDYEILTNFPTNQVWLNIWNDWNPAGKNPNSNRATSPTIAGYDWRGWTNYKIRWYPNRVEMLVNNVLARTETSIVPNDPQNIRFNLWAASSGWGTAYDAGIQPANSASANRNFNMDVDYIRVVPIDNNGNPVTPPANPVIGNGNGLAATYYDNSNFTGTASTRTDRQINFNWGSGAPVSNFGADTFSARWTGEVQAQYSQTYTFFARADDGIRVWVNNRQIINGWRDQGPTEYSGSIALQAGVRYPIRVEYYENGGGAVAQLSWSSPSTSKQLVPTSQLYSSAPPTPTPTPTPRPTATPTPAPGDTTAPTISVASPVSGWSYLAAPQARGTAADNVGVSQVTAQLRRYSDNLYWNGSAWQSAAANPVATGTTNWAWQMPPLSDGRYGFSATARDARGNARTSAVIDFYADATAPRVVITSPVNGATSATQASGTATDNLAGIAQVALRLQRASDGQYWTGGAWSSAVSDFNASGTNNWSVALPALTRGRYTMSARARDWAGNWGVSPDTVVNIP